MLKGSAASEQEETVGLVGRAFHSAAPWAVSWGVSRQVLERILKLGLLPDDVRPDALDADPSLRATLVGATPTRALTQERERERRLAAVGNVRPRASGTG